MASKEPRPLLACFPLYPPLELFHSMGLTPVILWGIEQRARPMNVSDKHVQNFSCLVGRAIVNELLQERSGRYAGLFSYNACDTLRNLPEIVDAGSRQEGGSLFSTRIHVPASHLDDPFARTYLAREIMHLIHDLENRFKVSFSPDVFKQSVELYREARLRIIELGKMVASGGMGFDDYSRIVHDSYLVPIDRTVERLKGIKDTHVPPGKHGAGNTRHKAILSGILPPAGPVCGILENAGFTVVGNDIASMYRSVQHTPACSGDPGSYYGDFYQHHYPCPTLLHSAGRREDALARLVGETKAECVFFIGEKFCEYEFFELPYIDKFLKGKGIKTLILESSSDDQATVASIKNRVESFSELLQKT